MSVILVSDVRRLIIMILNLLVCFTSLQGTVIKATAESSTTITISPRDPQVVADKSQLFRATVGSAQATGRIYWRITPSFGGLEEIPENKEARYNAPPAAKFERDQEFVTIEVTLMDESGYHILAEDSTQIEVSRESPSPKPESKAVPGEGAGIVL